MDGKIKKMQDPDYEKRLNIAMKAHELGCLIYSSDTGEWYTPREFVESDEKVVYTRNGLTEYHNFSTFYAKFAIESELSKLHKAEERFQKFMTKVQKAFDYTSKPKLKKM